MVRILVSMLVLFALQSSGRTEASAAVSILPPSAPIIPKVDTIHGNIRVDNYYWLKDRNDPQVIQYLEAENAYSDSMMKHTEALQAELYDEVLSRIKQTDTSAPVRIGEYYYYSRTEQGMQYSIRCRKKGSLDAQEEILLDINALAVARPYMALGAYEVSPDGRLLVYSIDTTGNERYTLFIKDLDGDSLFAERIENVDDQIAWVNDNQHFYYSVLDEAKRPYKVYQHRLGVDEREDRLVYHETDEAFWIDIYKTKSNKYITIVPASHNTSEVYYKTADVAGTQITLFKPREPDVEYYIADRAGKFYIRTNKDAPNFKLMVTPVDRIDVLEWQEIIPGRDSVSIDGFEVFENSIVLYETEKGLQRIHVLDASDNSSHYVEFPEPTYAIFRSENPEFNTQILRFEYTSLVAPLSVIDYSMNARTRELKKQYEVRGGYDPADYESERIWACAQDGVRIPISLVYKKGTRKDGINPLLLVGYGAYGYVYEPYFSANRLSLLNRGFVYAIAHVRGGGEMGEQWHRQGQFLNKMNTFTDFITCAEYLISLRYTCSERLAIYGGSAGGTLMGAVANLRPHLFRVVIADVPFVDVVTTLLDPSIPLTVVEYTELGDPHVQEYYEYMTTYSPYDNVRPQDYPNMLVRAGLNDTRVGYWEPAKWVAKLRALKTGDDFLMLKTNMGAGHGGSSGRYDYLRDVVFDYAFLLDVLGVPYE